MSEAKRNVVLSVTREAEASIHHAIGTLRELEAQYPANATRMTIAALERALPLATTAIRAELLIEDAARSTMDKIASELIGGFTFKP